MQKRPTRKLPPGKLFAAVTHFWDDYFPHEQETTLQLFLEKFRQYIKKSADHDFTEEQYLNIRNIIDPNITGTICLMEYYIFYYKFWNEIHERRKILKGSIPFTLVLKEDPMNVKQVSFTVTAAPRNSHVQIGDVFEWYEIDPALLSKMTKFDWTFGKTGCDSVLFRDSDPFFGKELFRVSKTPAGFSIKCTSKQKRLCLKIGRKPVFLIPGMLLRIGVNNIYQVIAANPMPFEENPKIYTLFNYHKGDFFEEICEKDFKSIDEVKKLFPKYK
jgi:hypothetical protein